MFKLNPAPTFTHAVEIPIPGGKPQKITFEFKHRTTEELVEFVRGAGAAERTDVDTIMGAVVGWSGVDAAFDADAVTLLCKNFHAAARAILEAYGRELTQARLGN